MTEPSGKSKGGKAAAAKLTEKQRTERAKKAVAAREAKKSLPKATHGSADHPLKIGDVEIACYVLDDGTRVVTQASLAESVGLSAEGGSRISRFVGSKAMEPFVGESLAAGLDSPVQFLMPQGGVANGYPATILTDLIDAVLEAWEAGKLGKQQEHIVLQCQVLARGLMRVGIIALVDEATGYQKDRARDALAQILEKFVAKELQPYVRTFPPDYYEEMFRLRGLEYPPENPKFRPQYFGLLTNDVVYGRLAPGLLGELKALAKKDERKAHLHRRLTQDIGHPKLREHLASVTTIMKLSSNYPDFIAKLNRIHPRFDDTLPLDLDEEDRG
ncbi:P63C domain-containing protein [Burkholderia cepacia]|uniref:P63C domain-containing protein n=1 Tax=Burkholderia cepacia complex TaxID=87882 RepID=UPI0008CF7A43|nr:MULTISPECIES: P63C domain-containing protein [Burkholderia cepacia complex]MBY4832583.1 P63C domain-containing protein [Burkholderia dolosa]SEU36136.1 P63C domain-containing protein [Burkholderia cepacia]